MTDYVIRGGLAGRDRLRVLAEVMQPSTNHFLDQLGPLTGRRCLDVGSGGGDVTRELVRRTGPAGHVVGVDFDTAKLELARSEAQADGVTNVEFRSARIGEDPIDGPFDLVYSRFLLTHLKEPGKAVAQFHDLLPRGGIVALEDIDFSGYFVFPESAAHRRYADLYSRAVRHNGADPDIGPRLPLLLAEQGFTGIEVSVAQPTALQGPAKMISPMTMENITEAVVAAGLASRDEVASLTQELYDYARDPLTLAGMPRVVQAWARK